MTANQDSEVVADLLNRAASGDSAALGQLVDSNRQELERMLYLRMDARLRSRVDAADILQETHLLVARKISDFIARQPMPFRLWLRKTAYECMLQMRRHHVEAQKRTVDREIPLPDRSSVMIAQSMLGQATPSEQLSKQEVSQRLHKAVMRLEPEDREILMMRNLEGLTNQEVALVLEVQPDAASKRYGRALLKLRRLLIEEGISQSQV